VDGAFREVTLEPVPFWFLRHGETDWNAQGISQGNVDIPLNAVGIAQRIGGTRAEVPEISDRSGDDIKAGREAFRVHSRRCIAPAQHLRQVPDCGILTSRRQALP